MGCNCCKKKKVPGKNIPEEIPEEQAQKEDDMDENLISASNRESETEINNIKSKPSQELPSTDIETDTEKNLDTATSIPEIKEPLPYEIFLKDYLDENIDNTEIFDKKWYSDIEKDKIIYSKRSIIAMINEAYDSKNEDFKEAYNKPPLFLAIKSSGSFITDEFQVAKNIYTVSKTSLPPNTSLKMLSKYMLSVKERNTWDPQLKLYEIVEGSEEGKEIKCILHNWMKSPMFLISQRDIVEKRFDFFHEGRFISYESSVNDDYIPLEEDVTRINDIICIQEIYEENENFIFRALNQVNAKVNLPQAIINMTLSGKLLDFYGGIVNAVNRDYKEGKLIFEDNEGNIIDINNNINNNDDCEKIQINLNDKE